MNLPQRYSYNPKSRLLVLSFGAGVAWIAVSVLLCGCRPSTFSLSFGLAPILLGLLLTVRRLGFKRYLVLDSDALVLPTGFLRIRNARIPYANIERVWQIRLLWMPVLCVGTKQGKFEVVSELLPEAGSYIAIGKFLNSRSQDIPRT
jgi:hypothetical protein